MTKFLGVMLLLLVVAVGLYVWRTSVDDAVRQCEVCPIAENYDSGERERIDRREEGIVAGPRVVLDEDVLGLISAEVDAEARFTDRRRRVEKSFNRILGKNPELTQRSNILRGVACAYLANYCNNPDLSDREKMQLSNTVIAEYSEQVTALSANDTSAPTPRPIPGPPFGDGEQNSKKSTDPPTPIGNLVPGDTPPAPTPVSTVRNEYVQATSASDVALYAAPGVEQTLLRGAVQRHLSQQQMSVNSQFFSGAFERDWGAQLPHGTVDWPRVLKNAPAPACICAVSGELRTGNQTVMGRSLDKVSGTTHVLLRTRSGHLTTHAIDAVGTGTSAGAARAEYARKLVEKPEFQSIPFHLCQ